MTPEQKEMADLLGKYHDEIVGLVRENTTNITKLDQARAVFVVKPLHEVLKGWVLPLLPLIFLIVAFCLFQASKANTLQFGEISISKQVECSQNKE